MADPVALLQRVAARVGAGRDPSADLLRQVYAWVAAGAGPILSGQPADLALGLRPKRGERSPGTRHRQRQRNEALAELYHLATGTTLARGESVLQWWGEYRVGRLKRPDVVTVLARLEATGIDPPTDAGSIARIASARVTRTPAVTGSGESETVAP